MRFCCGDGEPSYREMSKVLTLDPRDSHTVTSICQEDFLSELGQDTGLIDLNFVHPRFNCNLQSCASTYLFFSPTIRDPDFTVVHGRTVCRGGRRFRGAS